MNKSTGDFEIRLINGCKKGRSKSQEELYKHFYGYAMSICLRYASNKEEAKEILNDSFLKVFSKLEQFDNKRSFRGWLRRIVINTAIDYYRRNEKHRGNYSIDDSFFEISETDENVIDKLSAEDIMKLVQSLPESYRMTFNLYEVEGYSHDEIGEKLNVPVGTSRSNLSRAKKQLRQMVKNFLGIAYEKPLRS